MITLSQSLSILLPFAYLFIILLFGHIYFGRNKKLETKTILIITLLLVLHALQIILRGLAVGAIPLATKFDALSFLAFMILLMNLIIELFHETRVTLLFTLVLSFIIQTISSLNFNWNLVTHSLLANPIYVVHVFLTVLGYAAICISAMYALLYILLNHNIKYQRMGLIYDKLPPLRRLEKLSIKSIQIGIISLGLGILIGHMRAGELLGTFFPMDTKVILSNLIWFGYFTGYIIAQLNNWRGRWMAYLAIIGFGIFIIANIMIIFIENTFHQFQ